MKLIKTEHFGIARKIVSNMTSESWEAIPHAGFTYEADVSGFLDVIKEINQGKTGVDKISVNTAMLRVIVEGIKACPIMNSHIHFNRKLVRGRLETFENIDISMPVTFENGEMMTLNMHDMGSKTMTEINAAIHDTMRRAKNTNMDEVMYEVSLDNTLTALKHGKIGQTVCRLIGSKTGKHKVKNLSGRAKKEYYAIPETERLTKHDIEQGTITVSNLGSLWRDWHGDCALLEIIPPQIVAMAISAAQKTPMVDENDNIYIGRKMTLTLIFDHRAVDMGLLIPFVKKIDEVFKSPEIIKEWI
ncbi:MAG: 2-oxo acid dehydrogenase subunit E2 [Oscillospiraceae bacterium]|nr:2-oxo acid dehydrogenase subunit E2 [Oscillospiraceae bacterium]